MQRKTSSYFGGTEVLAHIINGILVLALAGLILSCGSRLRKARISMLSAHGLMFVIVAAATGATFAFQVQEVGLSLTMAMSFIIVYTVYLALFYFLEKIREYT